MSADLFDRAKAASGLAPGGKVDLRFCPSCGELVPRGGFGWTNLEAGDRLEYERSFVTGKLHLHLVRGKP